jgi:hypothetical protein
MQRIIDLLVALHDNHIVIFPYFLAILWLLLTLIPKKIADDWASRTPISDNGNLGASAPACVGTRMAD